MRPQHPQPGAEHFFSGAVPAADGHEHERLRARRGRGRFFFARGAEAIDVAAVMGLRAKARREYEVLRCLRRENSVPSSSEMESDFKCNMRPSYLSPFFMVK